MKKKCLTFMLSTFTVLSVFAQYYSKTYFGDLRLGRHFAIFPNSNFESLTYSGIVKIGSNLETNVISKISNSGELSVIKDIEAELGMFVLGRSMKIRNDSIFYTCTSRISENGTLKWHLGITNMEGHNLGLFSFPIEFFGNGAPYKYGMEIVKNNEIIIWGSGNDPSLKSDKNDPRFVWIRVKIDGSLISGPFYFKPNWIVDWAQPTDAVLDKDGNMVFVYSSVFTGNLEKYVFKLLDNDSIQEVLSLPLNYYENDIPQICVTKNGDYLVTNYDTSKWNKPPLLTKINYQGEKVWESSFDLIFGHRYGYYLPNVDKFTVTKIKEIKNGDILMCGFNTQIDSFYVPALKKKVLATGWTGGYISRFSSEGKLKWVHYLASLKDDGNFRSILIKDIDELEDGSIIVCGSLGDKQINTNKADAWVLRVGPNGCFDDDCSHKDKWWFFPDEIAISTIDSKNNYKLVLYPNPGSNNINLILPDEFQYPIQYQITDTHGKVIEMGIKQESGHSLEVQNLLQGIYFVKIKDKSGKIGVNKWIKQ